MTLAELKEYFIGTKRHEGYKKSCDLYEELVVHSEGRYPIDAIEKRRPSETDYIKDYRKEIFVPLAKETTTQLFNVFGKIRRSPDWMVGFGEISVAIAKGETLEEYANHLPLYGSLEFWVFSLLLKNYLLDAGAVVLFEPISEVEENEYLQPIPRIYNSPDVLEYDVLKNICILQEGKGVFVVVDDEKITRYMLDGDTWKSTEYVHGLGFMPLFKVPGRFLKSYKNYILNESPIQTIAARLKEFVREYSDLQAEVVQHIHSESESWANLPCKICETSGVSTGKIIDKKTKKQKVCTNCHGTGTVPSSPYTNRVVRGAKINMGEQEIPFPSKVYITKPVEIVKIQDERCERHIYKGLESLNLHFLLKTPANQSGYAKDVDGQETQNTVFATAEDLVWMLDKSYFIINEYRYKLSIIDENKRKELLPNIPVPEKFDLLSSMYLIDDITKANTAQLNPIVINAMQIELVKKKFYYDPEYRDFLVAVLSLDPLPGISDEDKMVRVANDGVSEQQYIVSSNIYSFIQKAIEDDKKFLTKKRNEQIEVLEKYADEILSSKEIKDDTEPNPEGGTEEDRQLQQENTNNTR